MKLLKILENRNHCLEKILQMSETFLSHFSLEDLTELDSFEIWRNNALKTLKLFDNHIRKLSIDFQKKEKTEESKTKIKNILEIGEIFIYYINTVDTKIIERIEREKGILLKSLTVSEQQKRTLAKFRSQNACHSGGQLDGKI